MADLGGVFDPAEVPQSERNFDPIPEGDYLCQVIASDVVPTKAGDGDEIIKLTIEVMEGRYGQRRVFESLNYRDKNETAQKIAQEALRDLCFACGLGPVTDTEQLHFHPFLARIIIEQDKSGRYQPKNRVRLYKSAQAAPPKGGLASVQVTAAPAQTKSARPWSRPAA